MPRTGRPRKEIDKRKFQKLCAIMCTLAEIAGIFDCSEDTVERWCERTFKQTFAEAYKNHSAEGKMSLRRAQFKAANEGNATMLVWLGKQYLGQKDKLIITDEDVDSAIESELARLAGGRKAQDAQSAQSESIH